MFNTRHSILNFINGKRFWRVVFLFFGCFILSTCAYRFSNLYVVRPGNIRSIAVEAIYDTSKMPIPHEMIWSNLQQAIAVNGHLKLVPASEADAILRIQVQNSATRPSGVTTSTYQDLEEQVIPPSGSEPLGFTNFKDLTTARAFYPKATNYLTIRAEVWHLTRKELLLERVYVIAQEFDAVRTGSVGFNNNFLRFHETQILSFSQMSKDIATKIVDDLLVR